MEDMAPRAKETRYTLYLIRKSPLVVAGIIIIAVYISLVFLAPYITPYGPTERDWYNFLSAPNANHIWGTDENGGDIYSMVIWATQVDLKIAISVVAVALAAGAFIGAAAGYFGGAVDEIVMRITDVFFAFPGLILAMAIVSALGARNLDNISIALMLVWWPTYARLVRGQVLIEREKLYVEAARSVGASDMRILAFHILPNTIQPVIVQATLDMGGVLLTAAGLSFIGFGAEAGSAEWGLMIAQGQSHFNQYWVTLYPGLAILFCALSFNLVGDGVRDILDPKLRRR
ncbi:ABC transporter permease [Candidatus Thorarchaeota archaeon]|nr:MAG: ABC transporter permease [Candidatus Thorarchaeota archaeon]